MDRSQGAAFSKKGSEYRSQYATLTTTPTPPPRASQESEYRSPYAPVTPPPPPRRSRTESLSSSSGTSDSSYSTCNTPKSLSSDIFRPRTDSPDSFVHTRHARLTAPVYNYLAIILLNHLLRSISTTPSVSLEGLFSQEKQDYQLYHVALHPFAGEISTVGFPYQQVKELDHLEIEILSNKRLEDGYMVFSIEARISACDENGAPTVIGQGNGDPKVGVVMEQRNGEDKLVGVSVGGEIKVKLEAHEFQAKENNKDMFEDVAMGGTIKQEGSELDGLEQREFGMEVEYQTVQNNGDGSPVQPKSSTPLNSKQQDSYMVGGPIQPYTSGIALSSSQHDFNMVGSPVRRESSSTPSNTSQKKLNRSGTIKLETHQLTGEVIVVDGKPRKKITVNQTAVQNKNDFSDDVFLIDVKPRKNITAEKTAVQKWNELKWVTALKWLRMISKRTFNAYGEARSEEGIRELEKRMPELAILDDADALFKVLLPFGFAYEG
ncbi:uncharacterized protein LY89DRAFT_379316 [Mollisia scopiformis]|uniref:Uncharacterized protein n=1 Tax=Mollisia scopiformis TaxID=149040 RepID=A0A194XN89_MOLSC|nr:uncharacterized protein LY89DRAFT_379316 [Mollisia scopiformis]KUJ21638.1 hypothetical protein LY89DRAFT_379316 [Mollisia scopiformis]